VLRGKSGGYQIRDTMKIRRGLAITAHDQAEHLTTLAILVQNGLESRRITRLVISSRVKLLITNNAFTLIEQQHSQKQEFFVFMVYLKLLRVFKPAGLTVYIFSLSFCSFCLLIWS
jgi:hypothetical protein